MKKFLKILGIAIGVVVLILIIGALYIQISGIPTYETSNLDYKVEPTPERIQRGKTLALMLCSNCHKDNETGKLTGKRMHDVPVEFGTIYSANITQDPQFGIGEWTDGEILYMLRTGINRTGRYAPPYMAKLTQMADEDVASIIAFLRSDDPMVQATAVEDRPPEASFLTKFLCRVAFKPFPMPDNPIPLPDTSNRVEVGRYLALNLDCYTCHSADFATNDYLNPENSPGFFGGGNLPLDMEGNPLVTQNLTPHDTGIGNWTEEKFVKAVKAGVKEGEPALRYPMMPYVWLSDHEAAAIFAYLQTVPPIDNDVSRSPFD